MEITKVYEHSAPIFDNYPHIRHDTREVSVQLLYDRGMRKEKTIALRSSPEEYAVLKKVAAAHGFSDGRGDGVSALMRDVGRMFAEVEKLGGWDSLDYLVEKMGKADSVVLAGILNARAKELLDKE